MTTKTMKTILFASLITAMILPFGMMDEAQAKNTYYDRNFIDRTFAIAQHNITYENETQHMILDVPSMIEDGLNQNQIIMVEEFANLQNELMDLTLNENPSETEIREHISSMENGKFRHLFEVNTATRYSGSYFSLTACGITFGESAHPHYPATFGLNNHHTKQSIQNALESMGYYSVQWPYADWDNVGLDYGKKNYTGYATCDDGEFRDQHFIYSPDQQHPTMSNWHTLVHTNEPNPDLGSYTTPTWWWNTYVAGWHYNVY